ncbi:MAG: hypothetical protein H7Y43_08045 [Akkermansiaceae bacterium]|nr:hypothetical protein [Verrucomicrobiales bacterium]
MSTYRDALRARAWRIRRQRREQDKCVQISVTMSEGTVILKGQDERFELTPAQVAALLADPWLDDLCASDDQMKRLVAALKRWHAESTQKTL